MDTKRNKIPWWAMTALIFLPIGVFLYVRALTPKPENQEGMVAEGKELYSELGCSSCHGRKGEGGVGRPLDNGALFETFPRIEDQLNLVVVGSQAYGLAGFGYYGSESVAHLNYNGAYMPAFGKGASDLEILATVCYTRYGIYQAELSDFQKTEYALWCAKDSPIASAMRTGKANFENVHEIFAEEDIVEIGREPRAGTEV